MVADGVVARLRDWGVRRVFGYAGDGIDPLLAALHRAGGDPELVTARHEEMTAFMAAGHAKVTGEVGVCLSTQGPGAIHLLAGLYDAKLDRKPVVAIVGQVVSTALGSGYLQEVDLHTLFKDVCGQYLQTVLSPEQLPLVLDNAFRTALDTSSPTCVIVPHDVQKAKLPEQTPHAHGVVATSTAMSRPHVVPRAADLDRAVEVLTAGSRPAILVGQGAYGAEAELVALAERLGAGVTASLLGKPVLDESLPYHCGVMGHLGTTASAELMRGCDTLLVVGSNDPWTEFYPAPGQARTVQVDIAARNIGTKTPVEVGLTGDARDTLAALRDRLAAHDAAPADPGWRDRVERAVRRWHDIREQRAAEQPGNGQLNPQQVVHALSAVLPDDSTVSVDVGSCTYWYARFLRLPPGVRGHVSGTLASMGCAMPTALAAKLAHPDRPVVVLAGDGAMQMNGLLELVTVARHWRSWKDPRFAVLVLHNRDLSEVSWEQREMEGDPRYPTSQEVPDFPYAGYAELLGLAAARIESAGQIEEVWRRALSADRPFLVEAVVDRDTPLLAPLQPDEKVEQMLAGIAQEPDGDSAAAALRRHRDHEA
ncbi:thiamine pyrophosphate-requiring protein [Pseudonocardia sp. S2-4]|uniref:Thiamine pyrophosphate-requiring protein n=1 Tax=Pseudonocardia humida TaxID=2800819 RepID=A0ABT0ZVC0_9PSEU|nr:thiamine pyrophosphate-requiring protein [Pseudonocardia humida]